MCAKGVSKIAVVEGTLDSTQYQKILEKTLLPAAEKWFEDGDWVFEQDHASVHDSKSSQEWVKENCPDHFEKSVWPAKSPDLSPIENLWAILEFRLNRTKVSDRDGLLSEIRKEWAKISSELTQTLVASMPTRIKAVIAAKGSHTRY